MGATDPISRKRKQRQLSRLRNMSSDELTQPSHGRRAVQLAEQIAARDSPQEVLPEPSLLKTRSRTGKENPEVF